MRPIRHLVLALALGPRRQCRQQDACRRRRRSISTRRARQPSTFTLELRNGFKATLPFADKRDFDEAKKGFIAAPPYKQIMADAGHVAWDMESYQWLLSGQDFPSIHPSLQRQAVLNMG